MTTLRRQVKNVIKNYTEAEVKVREATSNDPWGPSSTLMSEISDLTYNIVALGDIMRMIWKRLNDHGKNWRHVYKSLVLLDYLIKNGNEKVAQQCKEHIVAIQTLKDFQYIEENKDQGASVRDKAKQLVSLLRDDERLKNERIKALKARERYAQNAMGISSDNKVTYSTIGNHRTQHMGSSTKSGGNYTDPYGGAKGVSIDNEYATSITGSANVGSNGLPLAPDLEAVRPSDASEEEMQLHIALQISKQEHDDEVQRKRADEAKLQLAIEQSKLETSQDNGLLDLASGFTATDPWNDNFINTNSNGLKTTTTNLSDPWGPPLSTTTGKNQQIIDPWSSNTTHTITNNNNNNTNLNQQLIDPWASNTSTTTITTTNINNKVTNPWVESNNNSNTTTTVDPWSSSITPTNHNNLNTSNNNNNNNHNDLDEFEMFTSKRVTSPTNINTTTTNDPFDDFFGSNSTTTKTSSTNPWNDSTTTSASTIINDQNKINPIRKTPESFLGENSSLVNLDNLIPTTNNNNNQQYQTNLNNRPKSTNPFGSVNAQLSALQTSSSANSLFNRQPSNTVTTTTTTTTQQPPVSNPFLQQAQKPPSINQLNGNSANLFPSFSSTTTPSYNAFSVAPSAPFPTIPLMSTQQQHYQMPIPYLQPQQTTNNSLSFNQQSSTNPFL